VARGTAVLGVSSVELDVLGQRGGGVADGADGASVLGLDVPDQAADARLGSAGEDRPLVEARKASRIVE